MATLTAFSSLPAALRQGACTLLWGVALVGGAAHANAPVPEGPLVSTEWLAANLNRADVRIVEVSVNPGRSEEHTSELQSPCNLVCRLLLEKKKQTKSHSQTVLNT